MDTLLLYTTGGCHLCDLAETVLAEAQQSLSPDSIRFVVRKVEISDDPELVARYGVRIPVIRMLDQERDLGWPFGVKELANYLLMARPSA